MLAMFVHSFQSVICKHMHQCRSSSSIHSACPIHSFQLPTCRHCRTSVTFVLDVTPTGWTAAVNTAPPQQSHGHPTLLARGYHCTEAYSLRGEWKPCVCQQSVGCEPACLYRCLYRCLRFLPAAPSSHRGHALTCLRRCLRRCLRPPSAGSLCSECGCRRHRSASTRTSRPSRTTGRPPSRTGAAPDAPGPWRAPEDGESPARSAHGR